MDLPTDTPPLYVAIIGTVLLFEGTIFHVFFKRWQDFRRLIDPQHTVRTTAEIISINHDNSGKTPRHTIDYQFKDWRGNTIVEKHLLPHSVWETVQVGQHMPITYLRNKPTVSTLSDHLEVSVRRQKQMITIIGASAIGMPIFALALLLTQTL